jgi:hypothetical protein
MSPDLMSDSFGRCGLVVEAPVMLTGIASSQRKFAKSPKPNSAG